MCKKTIRNAKILPNVLTSIGVFRKINPLNTEKNPHNRQNLKQTLDKNISPSINVKKKKKIKILFGTFLLFFFHLQ